MFSISSFSVRLCETRIREAQTLGKGMDASYLARAGIVAAQSFTELPFRYFFKGDIATANTVAGVLNQVRQHFLGKGPVIGITCEDIYKN